MLDYTALTTPERVADAALGDNVSQALLDDVLAQAGSYYDEAVRTIEAVTGEIESTLQRPLVVREKTWYPDRFAWDDTPPRPAPDAYPYMAYLRYWPLVETISTEPEVSRSPKVQVRGERPVFAPKTLEALTAYVGYRRFDQGLGPPGSGDDYSVDLTAQDGLSGLSPLPPLLPGEIEDVCIRICLARLQEQVQGLIGLARKDKKFGGGQGPSLTVERKEMDESYEDRQLARLDEYAFTPSV